MSTWAVVESQHVPQIPAWFEAQKKKEKKERKRKEKRSFVDNCNHIFQDTLQFLDDQRDVWSDKERVMGQTKVKQLRSIINFKKLLL